MSKKRKMKIFLRKEIAQNLLDGRDRIKALLRDFGLREHGDSDTEIIDLVTDRLREIADGEEGEKEIWAKSRNSAKARMIRYLIRGQKFQDRLGSLLSAHGMTKLRRQYWTDKTRENFDHVSDLLDMGMV